MYKKVMFLMSVVVVLGLTVSAYGFPVGWVVQHHWDLEETEGTTAYDVVGTRDGTHVGDGITVNQTGPGDPDFLAYDFAGSADRVDLGSGWVPASGDFAFSVKFKTDNNQGASSDQGHLVSWNDGADTYRGSVYINDGSLGLWCKNGPAIVWGAITLDTWQTMEFVRQGNTWTLSLDGSGKSVENAYNFPQNLKVTFGGADCDNYGYDGLISDVQYVPEPTTIALLGMGSLVLLRRRKR